METKKDRSQSEPSTKRILSFSIESILKKDTRKTSNVLKPSRLKSGCTTNVCAPSLPTDDREKPTSPHNGSIVTDLPWLSYTRYSPPKLPRAKRRKSIKRKSSGNPRVPFSTSQLMTLEHKYLEARYLSGSEVTDLSTALSLSEHRVKIWFQNRRAREKKSHNSGWNGNDDGISFANPVTGGKCFMPGWFGTI
ncbi:homeobox protein MSX-1-like [Actinia tenebrosa]|uniref:Homeobox protein MSX-1-like n=1 Tax=Actinia tenebrosa TaxID=6105 RepID=A0A6P8H0M0_ACTTE|nr:homeobox protein MSX-1-like [Actinia tenebrosa]